MAAATGVHSSVLSQVFQGHRDLTQEQAFAISEYFGLSDEESDYLILLVQKERAGTPSLRKYMERRLAAARSEADLISKRVSKSKDLSIGRQAVFYSNWFYSAIRMLVSIPAFQTVESLESRLRISRSQLMKALKFLIEAGLCKERNGRYFLESKSTHLPAESPLAARHHGNWRVKAMERYPSLAQKTELAFTAPISLSKADVLRIRAKILEFIEEVCEISDPSVPESAYCLNIDWFEI
jgi:uncharacterized protein (TIGR02147 family)